MSKGSKFEEPKFLREIWFKKMVSLNEKSPEEIAKLFDKFGGRKIQKVRAITASAREKQFKDYSASNANYMWINSNTVDVEDRYYGKIIFANYLYKKFSDVLEHEEIIDMLNRGDLELASKLEIKLNKEDNGDIL